LYDLKIRAGKGRTQFEGIDWSMFGVDLYHTNERGQNGPLGENTTLYGGKKRER